MTTAPAAAPRRGLRLAAALAARELRGGLKGFRIFLACLALGVAAIAAIGTVRASINAGLAESGAVLLGGDAQMEFTYRYASEVEKRWMNEVALQTSEIVDFRSMAVRGAGDSAERALTQVKGVDAAYPLVGEVALDPPMPLATALAGTKGHSGAVMERVLIDRLGLEIGDEFALGTARFTLMAALTGEPDSASAGFSLGPRTLVLRRDLEGSGLLAAGTLFSTKYRLLLPQGRDLEVLQSEAAARFADAGMRWRDARNGAPGIARFVERLGSFLILVGLSGLAVGGIGVSSAVSSYLAGKTGVIATLRTLGAERRMIFAIYALQIAALSALGIVIGLVLGAGLPLLLAPVLAAQLPIPAAFGLYPLPLIEAAIYGALTAAIFTLAPLSRLDEIRAAALFRDAFGAARRWPRPAMLALIAGLLAALVALAALFNGAWKLTLITAGGLLFALALLALCAAGMAWAARRGRKGLRRAPALRWALAAIGGRGSDAAPVVLSLGLGLSVLAAVGQIDGNLRGAIARDLPQEAPSYFFVDIQKDQMEGFTARVEGDAGVRQMQSAPMLRGVITRINERPAAEVAGEHWVIRGDRGITYADAMPENTKITAGTWWGAGYDGPPQISFAAEEAEEMGLHLGDTMAVNILGREITATITSFREVDFSTAGMGFVMAMNAAALSGAPHSFIATVYADEAAEAPLLRDLAKAYPNITAIRVRDAIERVSTLLNGLAGAISYGAAATLLTGFLVLIGAAASGTGARRVEAAILKTLGATRARILWSFALRAALLGAAAGLVALAAGLAGGWAVLHFIMESDFEVIWSNAFAIIAGGIAATLLAALGFAWGPLQARPAGVLRARE